MKKYLSLFRIRFIQSLQYRSAAYAGIATQFFWGGLEILLYHAFYQADASAFPMTFQQLANYIWLQQAFLALFMTWTWEYDVFNAISTGSVICELLRPMDLYGHWFSRNLATRCARALLRCLPILVFAALLPAPYGLTLPSSPLAGLLFLPVSLLSVCTVIAFSMFVYISAFYTLDSRGTRIMVTSALDIVTGALLPLPFFPDWLQTLIKWTPFAGMQNLPLQLYAGSLTVEAAFPSILIQLAWLFIMVALGRLWMRRAISRLIVQGG